MGLIRRLLGLPDPQPETQVARSGSQSEQKHKRTHIPRELDLRSVPYVPLPPSPNSWELTDRPAAPEYPPQFLELVRAASERKFTKVLKLAESLNQTDLDTPVGELVARAYRDVLASRIAAKQWDPANRWATEMLTRVAKHLTDSDRRTINRLVDALDEAGKSHSLPRQTVEEKKKAPIAQVFDNASWRATTTPLPKDERPDPALKLIAVVRDGMLFGDFGGKSSLAAGHRGALLKRDWHGAISASRQIAHDSYRLGADTTSAGVAVMDSSGKLHVYNSALDTVLSVDLSTDPRVRDHFQSTITNYWGQFRTQVRAVDINSTADCYLFTIADEAWCCSTDGRTVWGVRTPLNEGWERAVGRSTRHVLAPDIAESLHTLGLALPTTPDDIKRAWRQQAHRNHPDRNPGDPGAVARMQRVNAAFEALTGVDPASLDVSQADTEVTFFRQTRPDYEFQGGGFSIQVFGLGGPPQDWIYGAAFRGSGTGAFLATYSGKVIETDDRGIPLRIYDLGSIPNQIVDTGDLLYILTNTRLYVLRNRTVLVALVDVFDQGRLFLTRAGIGLLDEKSFRWLTPEGALLGTINTRDPIRAVYSTPQGCVVETRQHRILVAGLQIA